MALRMNSLLFGSLSSSSASSFSTLKATIAVLWGRSLLTGLRAIPKPRTAVGVRLTQAFYPWRTRTASQPEETHHSSGQPGTRPHLHLFPRDNRLRVGSGQLLPVLI